MNLVDKPRVYTKEEVRKMFLDHVRDLVRYWSRTPLPVGTPGETDVERRVSGVAFSILSTLDGCSMVLPGFVVAPCPNAENKQYHKDEGSNWFPENHKSRIKCDIGGGLHEHFHIRNDS